MEKKIYGVKLVSLNEKTICGNEKVNVTLEMLDADKVCIRTPISIGNFESISDLEIDFCVMNGMYEFQTDYALIDRVMF